MTPVTVSFVLLWAKLLALVKMFYHKYSLVPSLSVLTAVLFHRHSLHDEWEVLCAN